MKNEEDEDEQCRLLLRALKGTAEGLLASHTANVWSVYGGLGRLHTAVLRILQHGLRIFTPMGEPDCWTFVEGLRWLQPSLATSPPFRPTLQKPSPSSSPRDEARENRYSDWLYRSLESHTLSGKLSWLLSDTSHLETSYESHAFLCRQRYAEAALICLRAVEQGQPSLLTDLDPRLYLSQWTSKHFIRSHRRCSSFPDNMRPGCVTPKPINYRKVRESRRNTTLPYIKSQLSCPGPHLTSRPLDRHWQSEPCLLKHSLTSGVKVRSRGRSATATEIKRQPVNSPYHFQSLLSVNYDQKTSREKLNTSLKESDDVMCDVKIQVENIKISSDESTRSSVELAKEANEENILSENIESKNNVDGNMSSLNEISQNTDDITSNVANVEDPNYEFISTESIPVEILTVPKRPTNLSLSMTTSSEDAAKNNSQIRRSSDTAIQNTKNKTVQLQENSSPNMKSSSYKSNFRPVHTSSPNFKEFLLGSTSSHSSPKKVSDTKKLTSDIPVYEHTPPRATPSYTPSSSISLSPPCLPPAVPGAYCSLPMSRRTSEVNSFLASSGRFSDPAEELGRENAHFSVSEAMIAAIERAKCERIEREKPSQRGRSVTDDTLNSEEEDDEEIARLKERIRVRRREKEQREKRQMARTRRALRVRRALQPQALLSDGRTDTGTPNTTTATDQSDMTPASSSSSLDSEGEGVRDIPVETDRHSDNLARLRDSGLSVSMASLYSESELAARQHIRADEPPVAHWSRSAEGVALGLLRQFNDKALPRDSELQWLVSEQDAPQSLLPLPASWPVSPDEAEDEDMTLATPLRGTLQWAPPRAQIIFTPHPAPKRRILLASQGYLCAGCGMKVEPQYASKFRYCEYLGRYFCTGCHGNQLAVIPGKVLTKWDFTRCPVSGFSYRLLEQMQTDALFRVEDLSPTLFQKSRQLSKCKLLRIQVSQLRDFVVNCRFASQLHELYAREPPHITTDPELYSLKDLIDVKSGELITRLQDLVTASKNHVSNCELCTARGFVCEICRSREIIFPWDVTRIVRCRHCGCCLHMLCWKGSHTPATSPGLASPDDCPRCIRLKARHSYRDNSEV